MKITDEMVEAAARAMYADSQERNGDNDTDFDEMSDEEKDGARSGARAALKAALTDKAVVPE